MQVANHPFVISLRSNCSPNLLNRIRSSLFNTLLRKKGISIYVCAPRALSLRSLCYLCFNCSRLLLSITHLRCLSRQFPAVSRPIQFKSYTGTCSATKCIFLLVLLFCVGIVRCSLCKKSSSIQIIFFFDTSHLLAIRPPLQDKRKPQLALSFCMHDEEQSLVCSLHISSRLVIARRQNATYSRIHMHAQKARTHTSAYTHQCINSCASINTLARQTPMHIIREHVSRCVCTHQLALLASLALRHQSGKKRFLRVCFLFC